MCTLSNFPIPPLSGEITLGEFEGQLISGSSSLDIRCFKNVIASYPNIDVSSDILRPHVSRESARNAFIEASSTTYKKIINSWNESGVLGVLKELSRNEVKENFVYHWIGKAANSLLTTYNWFQILKASIFPHLRVIKHFIIKAKLSHNINRLKKVCLKNTGIVRVLVWHPQTMKCAVALRDDSIRIFTSNNKMIPVLKHRLQKEVTSMAWKPYYSSILAVACNTGVLVWQIDPTSLVTSHHQLLHQDNRIVHLPFVNGFITSFINIFTSIIYGYVTSFLITFTYVILRTSTTRPSSSCVTFLKQKGPVTCVSWHPDGSFLVSSSAADSKLHVWNVAMETKTYVQRMGGGGVTLLKWSMDGKRLFTATPSSLFRVWETTQNWTCEKWTNLVGHCKAACWSPDGSILLFATLDEPVIYFLNFPSSKSLEKYDDLSSKSAIPVIDLTQILVNTGNDEIRIGGRIQNMIWDKTGERLAVSFKDNSELIAIFRTKVKPILEIHPLGFVRGLPTESVQLMTFHDHFYQGALLTVCWSSGRIVNIPFFFVSVDLDLVNKVPEYEKNLSTNEIGLMQRKHTIYSSSSLENDRYQNTRR
ncbi:LOW QUALITY PROTEIN: aladin-like [Centruroides sculpturatus]|uniref:LOW QUALITY PROTEIN: aladin-like n=1 Tax=Centruroides sculpturatus TaxID=218467 RepID=UPI000C6EEDEE|nr:LOW QUALITY PROTEIN: aladin-like [Centruroides sculpturatus]